MKNIFLAVLLLFTASAFCQNYTYYSPVNGTTNNYNYFAAAKAGLSMREQPNTNAKVLEKIPYGAKILTLTDTIKPVAILTEGFNGWWWKVQYNNKIGYVVSSYVLPVAPPKAGTKTLQDY